MGGEWEVLRVDLSACRYESVRTNFEKLSDWKVVERHRSGKERGRGGVVEGGEEKGVGGAGVTSAGRDYDLYWTDRSVTRTRFMRLLPHQMANHFPDMHELCCKSFLASNLCAMRKQHPDHYDFFPDSWILPDEYKDFSRECRRQGAITRNGDLFIVKPERGCQGKGIFLTRTAEHETIKQSLWSLGKLMVAQRYISNTLLIDGFKFDLRLYVLISCCDPLRVYVYRDGLARFCTERFDPNALTDGKTSLPDGWAYTHLTNSSLNKGNEKFRHSSDDSDPGIGSKRRISRVFELLKARGADVDKLWESLEDVVVKATISAQPLLAHQHRLHQPKDPFGDRCFEILGADVLLDTDLKPWLLELNHSPSYHCEGIVDSGIKRPLLREAMRIVGPSIAHRAAARRQEAAAPLEVPAAGVGGFFVEGASSDKMLAKMRSSVVHGIGVQSADRSAKTQQLSEFDQDRPRYQPAGAERMEWVGRTQEEEEAFLKRHDLRDGEVLSGFHRCFPAPKGSEREAVYTELLKTACRIHASRTKSGRRELNEESSDDGHVVLSSSGSSAAGSGDDQSDLDELQGEEMEALFRKGESGEGWSACGKASDDRSAFGADDKAGEGFDAAAWWQRMTLRWSGFLFGAGVFFPPLMIALYFVYRRLRKWDYEAEVWTSMCKVTLCIQIPVAVLLGIFLIRLEMAVRDIASGKNAIPLDDFLKTSPGQSHADSQNSEPSHGDGQSHYCGAHSHGHSHSHAHGHKH